MLTCFTGNSCPAIQTLTSITIDTVYTLATIHTRETNAFIYIYIKHKIKNGGLLLRNALEQIG